MRAMMSALVLAATVAGCGPQPEEAKAPPTAQSETGTKAETPATTGSTETTADTPAAPVGLDICGLVADPAKTFGQAMTATAGNPGDGVAGSCSWGSAKEAAVITTAIARVMTDESLAAAGQVGATAKKAFQENLASARAAAVIEDVSGVGEYAFWQVGRGGSGKLQFVKADKLVLIAFSTSDEAADPKAAAIKLAKEIDKGL